MKYILLTAIFNFMPVSYASENKYEHIIDAVNNSPDLAESRKKTFAQVQNLIYQRSPSEITQKQLRELTVPQLGLLIKEIKSRSIALQMLDKSKETPEIQRLCKLQFIIMSEYKKWRDKFVYNENKKDLEHFYVYHPNYY